MEYLESGPCPHRQADGYDCLYRSARGPVVCNVIDADSIRRCPRFYRMCGLRDLMPELWTGDVCCTEYRLLMLRCAEESGFAAGCVDVRIYPNDGKDVWRNYERVRLQFCPYCGAKQAERKETT